MEPVDQQGKAMNSKPRRTLEAVERFDRDPETARLRLALLEARDSAHRTRVHVDSYILPLFQTFRFVRGGPLAGEHAGEPITHPQDLYLTDQEDEVKRFYAACDAQHRAHGYELPGPGYCPALVARHAMIQAENALLDHAGRMLGIDFLYCYDELREDALEILENGPSVAVKVAARRAARRERGKAPRG